MYSSCLKGSCLIRICSLNIDDVYEQSFLVTHLLIIYIHVLWCIQSKDREGEGAPISVSRSRQNTVNNVISAGDDTHCTQ